jgi:hypothetical protein
MRVWRRTGGARIRSRRTLGVGLPGEHRAVGGGGTEQSNRRRTEGEKSDRDMLVVEEKPDL